MEYKEIVNKINNNDRQNYDIKRIKDNFQQFIPMVEELKESCDNAEILEAIVRFKTVNYTYKLLRPNMSQIYMNKTIEYILENKEIINEILPTLDIKKLKESEENLVKYTHNLQRNSKILIENIVEVIYKQKSKVDFNIMQNILRTEGEEKVKEFIEDDIKNEEKNYKKLNGIIYKVIEQKFAKSEKSKINEDSIERLSNTVKLLDEINTLKVNNDINNKRLDELNLEFLKFDYENDTNKKSGIAIKDLMDEEFLKRFDIYEITALNAFYVNRLVKVLEEYNWNLYFAKKMDIYTKIINNEPININLTDEEIRHVILQKEFLKEKSQILIKDIIKNYEKEKIEDTSITKQSIISSKRFQNIKEQYKEKYEELYNKIYLPNFKNDFVEDLITSVMLETDMYNLYEVKNMSIQAIMMFLIDKDKEINWGYIPEEENGKNSIERGNKYILIGFDLKGYNMPIKLHVEKDKIEKFLSNYTNSTIIPMYEGNEDMEINDKFLTTQVLMKLSKSQRAKLKSTIQTMSPDDERYKYIEHLNWMMFPKRYPNYLKQKDGTIKPKKKIDLQSGIEQQDEENQKNDKELYK